MLNKLILISGALLLTISLYLISVTNTDNGHSGIIKIKGAVKNEINLSFNDLEGIKSAARRIKIYDDKNEYLGNYELDGVALGELLSLAGVAKKTDDGFDRELDMYVVVRGRSGRSALFSYGEIFLDANFNSVILTKNARFILPDKHEDLKPFNFNDRLWHKAPGAHNIDLKNCAACHNAKDERKLYFPRGYCVYPTSDSSSERFIEDAYEIEICQIAPRAIKMEKHKENMWSESIIINICGKNSMEIWTGSLSTFYKTRFIENTIGLGKGFHGKSEFEGYNMACVLNQFCPPADYAMSYYVITADDGYRSLFSAAEIFNSSKGANLFLVDIENGAALKKGSGRFRAFIREDFFIDRCVRAVKEIHYNHAQ